MERLAVVAGMGILVAAALLFAVTTKARGHEAITGWEYPTRCCHDNDCGVALSAIRNPDGSLTVTTKHGTATFPASFAHEPSPDGLIHACFTSVRLYCLYLSTGI